MERSFKLYSLKLLRSSGVFPAIFGYYLIGLQLPQPKIFGGPVKECVFFLLSMTHLKFRDYSPDFFKSIKIRDFYNIFNVSLLPLGKLSIKKNILFMEFSIMVRPPPLRLWKKNIFSTRDFRHVIFNM